MFLSALDLYFHFLFFVFFSSFILFFFFHFSSFFFLVDIIIKPKPLPRNILNGNSIHTNNVTNSSICTNTINQMPTKVTSMTSTATNNNNENRSSIVSITSTTPSNVNNHSLSSSPKKTESLIQRFSFSNTSNGKSPPEVLKRIAGKQIATIFEVRIHVSHKIQSYIFTPTHTHTHAIYKFVYCFKII